MRSLPSLLWIHPTSDLCRNPPLGVPVCYPHACYVCVAMLSMIFLEIDALSADYYYYYYYYYYYASRGGR